MSVTFKTGGRIIFKSGDAPDSIYGPDYESAVIDEASRVKEAAFDAVMSTLTKTEGPLRVIGNVKGRKNWAYRLGQRAKAGEEGMSYHRISWRDAVDAGIIKQSSVDDARRLLPENVFQELYEAEASDDGGNPFGLQHIERCVSPAASLPVAIWGVDLAKSVDWTVAIGLAETGQWVEFHRWQGPWEETIRRLTGLIGETRAIVDSTGVGDPVVESLQRALPVVDGYKFSAQSKQRLMEGLAVALQSQRTTLAEGVWRTETEAYEYEFTGTGVRYSAPDGMNDDCVCAHALAVSGILNPATAEAEVVFAGNPDEDDDARWF